MFFAESDSFSSISFVLSSWRDSFRRLSSMILTYTSPSFTLHINCLIKLPLTFGSATAMAVRVTTGSAQQLGGSQPKDRTSQ
ncbi:hypothetical protein OIU74_012822 [Salix koriyanagi]|uniref:Uncharacterized protein n=1 Tax=Salix koriyanagi TaxID=2511006 RepID=A0A9Q0T4Y1_9ROSI|nr:hypothetical protein OIU74_012822 [Salix koriyanagi]